jgi:hypothetical protein
LPSTAFGVLIRRFDRPVETPAAVPPYNGERRMQDGCVSLSSVVQWLFGRTEPWKRLAEHSIRRVDSALRSSGGNACGGSTLQRRTPHAGWLCEPFVAKSYFPPRDVDESASELAFLSRLGTVSSEIHPNTRT